MRIFSPFERLFLKQVISLEETGEKLLKPNNFLKGLLKINCQVTIVGREPNYILKDDENHFYKIELLGKKSDVLTDYFVVTSKLYESNDLMEYLLQNGYLLRHHGGVYAGLLINMQLELEEGIDGVEKLDIHINHQLNKFLEKCGYYYMSTEALRDLVKNNFRTRSERNNYWTRVISICSLFIAILAIGIDFFNDTSKQKESDSQVFKIDTASINYYIKNIDKKMKDTVQDKLKIKTKRK